MDGILGTSASLNSDISLLAYIFVLFPGMMLGFYFARQKKFSPHHKGVMTGVVIINWVLIFWLMLASYRYGVAPNLQNDPASISELSNLLPTLHLITGGISQLLATYLVLLMWTENTPLERIVIYRIKNIKTPMRVTLGLWVATVALGILIYITWYGGTSADASTIEPVATEEASDVNTDASPSATEPADSEANQPDATEEASTANDSEPVATEETSDGNELEPIVTEEANS